MKKKSFDEVAFAKRQNALYLYALKFAFRFSDDIKSAETIALRSLAAAQKELPAASKRAFCKKLKYMILQNCAAYEDDANANTPSPVQKAYEKYQNGRKRKKRFLAVTASVLAAVIVAAILCATLIPAALKRNNDTDDNDFSSSRPSAVAPFLIGEMYKGPDKSITFFGISAHNALTIDGETHERYYLIASAVIDDDHFLINTLYPSYRSASLMYCQNDESISPSDDLPINAELTKACSTTEVSICDWNSDQSDPQPAPYSQTHGIVNFVYDLTQKQYEFLYEFQDVRNEDREAHHQGEIDIQIPDCPLGGIGYAYFTFFYHQIRFKAPPEEESGEMEQPSEGEGETIS